MVGEDRNAWKQEEEEVEEEPAAPGSGKVGAGVGVAEAPPATTTATTSSSTAADAGAGAARTGKDLESVMRGKSDWETFKSGLAPPPTTTPPPSPAFSRPSMWWQTTGVRCTPPPHPQGGVWLG